MKRFTGCVGVPFAEKRCVDPGAKCTQLISVVEHLRSAADFMAALYCFDEYTDQGDEAFVRQAADIVKDALRNPLKSRSEGEMPIGEVFRQWVDIFPTSSHAPTLQSIQVPGTNGPHLQCNGPTASR
jgi:hypothetical protein